jgi:ribonuclease-3
MSDISRKMPKIPWNERLEFLGDAVLGLVIATKLMKSEGMDEGQLSKIRASLVNEDTLAEVGCRLGLDQALILGRGEEKGKGRQKPSMIADALEATIGAIYVDAGFKAAERVVLNVLFKDKLEGPLEQFLQYDFKTILQEYMQSELRQTPVYEVLEEIGPQHNREFKVAVIVDRNVLGAGLGKSKKMASQKAAKTALQTLGVIPQERGRVTTSVID